MRRTSGTSKEVAKRPRLDFCPSPAIRDVSKPSFTTRIVPQAEKEPVVVVVGVSVPAGNVAVCVDLREPCSLAACSVRVIVCRKNALAVDHAVPNPVAIVPPADDDARPVDPEDVGARHALGIIDPQKPSVVQQVTFGVCLWARLREEHDVAMVIDAECVRP